MLLCNLDWDLGCAPLDAQLLIRKQCISLSRHTRTQRILRHTFATGVRRITSGLRLVEDFRKLELILILRRLLA